ncbi:MAG: hypothetical protein AB7P00_25685, partial [Sandaracinaceae bacterium]
DDDTRALRPSIRPWLIAGLVNLTHAFVLLGIPSLRGPSRAEVIPARFAAFAACLYDATPEAAPGLGLPPGDRSRYASMVVSGPPDWPERCRAPLAAIPPEESRFLFPGVKNAEAMLRAAVRRMDHALAALALSRGAGSLTVPHAPMDAMGELRGALAELGLVSGVAGLTAQHDAIRIAADESAEDEGAEDDSAALATPSFVPLRVSRGGEWDIAIEDGALLAGTMDTRAAVHVRVEGGSIQQLVTRRPRLVTALLGARQPPWLLWTTPDEQCADAVPHGCSRRSTGLAAFLEDRQTLEPMMWIGAHPRVHVSHAYLIDGSTLYALAVTEDGAAIRRFALTEPRVRALGQTIEVPRISADASWPVATPRTIAWLEGSPPRALMAGADGVRTIELAEGSAEQPLDIPDIGRALVVRACGTADDGWIVVAAERAAYAVRAPTLDVFPLDGVRLSPTERASLDPVCDGPTLRAVSLERGRLRLTTCDASGCASPVEIVAAHARAFDAELFGGALLVAWTDDPEEGPVRLARVALDSREVTETIPSPCWSEPADGLCGEPRLATDGTTLMVVTRQDEDLRALESSDGVTWSSLTGLLQH